MDGKTGLCERQHFSSYTKKFEMIIGPKLDLVDRTLEGLCGCPKLTIKEKKRKIESKSKELSGEKKRRKLDSESTKKNSDKVDGGENDSEIAEVYLLKKTS